MSDVHPRLVEDWLALADSDHQWLCVHGLSFNKQMKQLSHPTDASVPRRATDALALWGGGNVVRGCTLGDGSRALPPASI